MFGHAPKRIEVTLKEDFADPVNADRPARAELIDLLQSWIDDDDAQEQKETGE